MALGALVRRGTPTLSWFCIALATTVTTATGHASFDFAVQQVSQPSLYFDLYPEPEPARLRVEVRASGPSASLSKWIGPVDQSSDIAVRDDTGSVEFSRADGVLTLDRAVVGPVALIYTVPASPALAVEDQSSIQIDPARVRIPGQAALMFPAAMTDTPVPTRVTTHRAHLEENTQVASSLGVGRSRALVLSGAALHRTMVLAGLDLGHAEFDGPEGHDEAAWLGYTSFDPRIAAAEVAGFRTGAAEFFQDKRRIPMMLLMVSDTRGPGRFEVARLPASVVLHVGASEVYSGPVRISVLQQVLAQWFGGTLSLDSAESIAALKPTWFTVGVARFFARELAFDFGLLTPEERRDEVENLVRLVLTTGPDTDPDVVQAARGALFATWLDQELRARAKPNGSTSLGHIVRPLLARSITSDETLDTDDFVQAVAKALPSFDEAALRNHLLSGALPAIQADLLAPCFRAAKRKYETFELGFAETKRPDGTRTVERVVPNSAASRAGIAVGDQILSLRHVDGDPNAIVNIKVARGSETEISFRPVGTAVEGPGFVRIPSVPAERCTSRGQK